jgi:hypothetical protein
MVHFEMDELEIGRSVNSVYSNNTLFPTLI